MKITIFPKTLTTHPIVECVLSVNFYLSRYNDNNIAAKVTCLCFFSFFFFLNLNTFCVAGNISVLHRALQCCINLPVTVYTYLLNNIHTHTHTLLTIIFSPLSQVAKQLVITTICIYDRSLYGTFFIYKGNFVLFIKFLLNVKIKNKN